MKIEKKNSHSRSVKEISRKEAIKKFGKYAAVTSLGTFMLLSPQKAQANSAPPPGSGF